MSRRYKKDTTSTVALREGRLNRYIARAGVCSRRKADDMIDRSLVKVNGSVVKEYWTQVTENDVVEVNGCVVSPRQRSYVLLNKPQDTITTASDERGRRNVFDLVTLPEDAKAGLFSVGRLDKDTVGVLLLTNDGELGHRLMHPRYEVAKRYTVRTRESVRPHLLEKLRSGVTLDDGLARADMAVYVDPSNHKEIGLEIHEGRNRQIRRMFEALGISIARLERVAYADLTARDVRRGRFRCLQAWEIRKLRKLVHLT